MIRSRARAVLCALLALTLSACMASGYSDNPWDRTGANRAAQSAPSDLAAPAATPGPGSLTPAPGAYRDGYMDPRGAKLNSMSTAGFEATFPEQQGPGAYESAPLPVPAMAGAGLPPVKVALLVPLSGDKADIGQAMLNAAQMALFDIGFESFELMPHDTKGTAEGARMAAESAAAEGAQLILGPVFAADVRAVKPVAQRSGLKVIAFSTDWTLADGNTYIVGFLPFIQVQRVIGYAAQQGLTRIGILAPDTEYGNAVVQTARAEASRRGVSISGITMFPADGRDLGTHVGKFAAAGPYDAVLLPAGGEQARAAANFLSLSGMDAARVRRLGTGLWDDAALATEPNLDGGWFAAPSPRQRAGFERDYARAYGDTPPRLASLAYDATSLAAVLARTGVQQSAGPAFDRASITNPNGFAGIDGIFRFRPDGLVERGLAIAQFRNGQIVEIDPAPTTFQIVRADAR